MHRLNLAANKKIEELVYASTVSTKSSIILKDSLIIEKRKLKMTYFFKNNRFGATAVSLLHGIFHRNLSLICHVNSPTLYFMPH